MNDDGINQIYGMGREPVFITGMGPVCPAGTGIQALGRHFWQVADYEGDEDESQGASEILSVPEFDLADYVPTTRPYLDRHSECMLAAASMALGWTGEEAVDADESRRGLVTGTMFGNVSSVETFQDTVRAKGMRLASPVLFPHCYPNTSNSVVSIEFDLRGYNENHCGDHLCGAMALRTAYETLKKGCADLMVAGGGDLLSANFRKIIGEDESVETVPMGEGAVLLSLETKKSLSDRGTEPLCKVAAVVGRGTGISVPTGDEREREEFANTIGVVLSHALERANKWEGDIGAVFATTPWGGEEWISSGVKEALSGYSTLPQFFSVPTVGHTWAAAYPLQCTLAAMALRQGELPTPPRLENVEEGVETWMEEEPTPLLGDAVLVVGATHRQIVVTVLETVG